MVYKKICRTCGNEFEAGRVQTRYCCDICREIGNRRNVREANKRFRAHVKNAKEEHLTIAEINERARKCGMTYGQYIGHAYSVMHPLIRQW